jgi:hypothetical protein
VKSRADAGTAERVMQHDRDLRSRFEWLSSSSPSSISKSETQTPADGVQSCHNPGRRGLVLFPNSLSITWSDIDMVSPKENPSTSRANSTILG